MSLYTDVAIKHLVSDADGMSAEDIQQLADDARLIYSYVNHQPGADEHKLRVWADGRGLDPDRITAALGLLGQLGKVYDLSALPPGPDDTPEPLRRPQDPSDGKSKRK